MTLAERVDVSAGREAAVDRAGGAGLRANEGTTADSSAGSASFLRGGLRGGGTGADAVGVAIGGFGIGVCADFGGGGGDADAGAGVGRVACAVGCELVAGAGGDAVVGAVFSEPDCGVDDACAGLSTRGACVVVVGAMGLFPCGKDAGGMRPVVAARGSCCTCGVCTGAAVRVVATSAVGPAGCTAGADGAADRAGAAGGGTLVGGAVCGNADVWSGAFSDCSAAGTGATTFAGVRGAAIIGVSMVRAM